MRKPSEILRAAKGRIEDPERWCQGSYGSSRGRMCALGALMETERFSHSAEVLLADAGLYLFGFNAVEVNDKLGHAAVMQMYDRALEMAEREEGHNADKQNND